MARLPLHRIFVVLIVVAVSLPWVSAYETEESQEAEAAGWWELVPRVVNASNFEPVKLIVYSPEAEPFVTYQFPEGEKRVNMEPMGNGTYSVQLLPDDYVRNYRSGSLWLRVGPLYSRAMGNYPSFGPLVRQPWMPDVKTVQLGPDIQISPHIVNVRVDRVDHDLRSWWDLEDRLMVLFARGYDFVFVQNAANTVGAVKNLRQAFYSDEPDDVMGTGKHPVEARRGLDSHLKGTVWNGWDASFDHAGWLFKHELGHEWFNYLGNGKNLSHLGNPEWHWPPRGDVGFFGELWQWRVERLPDGRFEFKPLVGGGEYSDLELYLMGLFPPNAVNRTWIFTTDNYYIEGRYFNQGPGIEVTAQQIVEAFGPRNPSYEHSQRVFRTASVVLSRSRLLDADEMVVFDYLAARGESRGPVPAKYVTDVRDPQQDYPWFVATRGLSTMNTSLPSVTNHLHVSASAARFQEENPPGTAFTVEVANSGPGPTNNTEIWIMDALGSQWITAGEGANRPCNPVTDFDTACTIGTLAPNETRRLEFFVPAVRGEYPLEIRVWADGINLNFENQTLSIAFPSTPRGSDANALTPLVPWMPWLIGLALIALVWASYRRR